MYIDHESSDRPKEACGVFGIHNHPEAARLAYFGLYALQHRGQESAALRLFGMNVLHFIRVWGLFRTYLMMTGWRF